MRAVLAALILGGVFGTAAVTVEAIDDDRMVIDLSVEVRASAESVVAHLAFEEEPILTLPLLNRGDGVFGIRTELEPKNYAVVFEIVGDDPETSGPVSLTQMGAELGPESGSTTTTTIGEDGLSRESRALLWLALALTAASLSVLAFWVLGGRKGDNEQSADVEEE